MKRLTGFITLFLFIIVHQPLGYGQDISDFVSKNILQKTERSICNRWVTLLERI